MPPDPTRPLDSRGPSSSSSSSTAVVTGASSGIGLALTRLLLATGWQVAAVVRSSLPDEVGLHDAREAGLLRTYRADLADAQSRRSLADALQGGEPDVDVLFNNAGVSTGSLQFSPQGRELHYEVNCLAPWSLTAGLAPSLSAGHGGRVVTTVSDAFAAVRRFDPTDLARPRAFRVLVGPYATSKLAVALSSQAAARDLAAQRISVVTVAPGPNRTPLVDGEGMPRMMRPLARAIAKPSSYGANLLLRAAVEDLPSGSFVNRGKVRNLPHARQAQRVWDVVAADLAEEVGEV